MLCYQGEQPVRKKIDVPFGTKKHIQSSPYSLGGWNNAARLITYLYAG
jgi:hypothetical protein